MPRKLIRKPAKKIGASPGTLVHTGAKKTEQARIRVIDYSAEKLSEVEIPIAEVGKCCPLRQTDSVSWVNVDGLHEVNVIETLGGCYGLHPLVMEDILSTEQRPKVEAYEDYLFIVMRMLHFDADKNEIKSEQVSLILGPTYVISFQEREGDVFDGVRERIRSGRKRIRASGPDYLAYALLDAVVDSYFHILEKIGDQVELLENELVTDPTPATLQKIHEFKREMILLRKSIWPLREVLSSLHREESALIREATGVFLRDVYDHTIQVVDTVETLRDIIGGQLDLYLSSISNRMNEVMKVLTIMATIFIPLTFVAGIYGMNFEFMPELKWKWSYPVFWLVICLMGGAMVVFFKKKKWL
ncbi:magnesium and cobalt transport protein CorA [Desulfuromonas versatilis]|uniref:Magnesium transport protein CorA n=1 Tax=Desulfuromonas versatilis TaxID=2802975 RepID=A0ABM8HTL5_9BACT|nr:magnesium/cobalt transporter CorA [Desulfuromonas versatilis]BCR03817.1 magnesium and cobalt transport protein CorA [Desulfuromonas versatilis]